MAEWIDDVLVVDLENVKSATCNENTVVVVTLDEHTDTYRYPDELQARLAFKLLTDKLNEFINKKEVTE